MQGRLQTERHSTASTRTLGASGCGERLRQGPVEDRTGPELPVVRATRLTAGDADMQADLLRG